MVRSQGVPDLIKRKEREILYLESISASMSMLKLDPKSFDLSIQVVTPFDK